LRDEGTLRWCIDTCIVRQNQTNMKFRMPFRKKNKRKGQQPADANGESLSLSGLSLTKTQQCSSSTRFGEQKGNRRRPSYAFNERKLSAGDKSGRFSESSKRKDAGSPDLKDEVDIETLRHTSTAGATSQIPISFSDVENGGTEYNSKNYCQESLLEKMKCNGAQASSKASVSRISNVSDELHGDSCLEHPTLVESYDRIPLLEITKLPRGGVSVQTEAVGRIQYGIPPETIKDSMRMGLTVPSIYIVPVERFCRELGPALGVNLAEFEFPAYFNFFILNKRCTLIVDSFHAEHNIRRVFSETLLGPSQFRKEGDEGITYEEEDFSPEFPRSAIPDFKKELKHFRFFDGKEMVLDTLLNFHYFEAPYDQSEGHNHIGVPPALSKHSSLDNSDNTDIEYVPDAAIASDDVQACGGKKSELSDHEHVLELSNSMSSSKKAKTLAYAQVKLAGEVAVVYPTNTTPEQRESKSCKRVEIFKMPGGTEYVIHDVDENNVIVGKVRFSGNVRVSESMSVAGFGGRSMGMFQSSEDAEMGETKESNDNDCDGKDSSSLSENILPPTFHPPSFGVTVLGNSHGFDKSGSVSGYVLWINGRGVMIDPPPYSSKTLELEGIRPRLIVGIILTHCHADHDAGAFQKLLGGSPVVVITTPTIYKSFIRKYAALSNLSPALLRHCHRHKPAIIGAPLRFQGATFHFTYTLHSIPCVGFRVEWRGRSMVFTGDHFNSPEAITKLQESGVLSVARAKDLMNLPLQETDLLLHESGQPPIHTPLDVLLKLPQRVKDRLYVVHTSALPPDCELRVAPTGTEGTIRLDKDIPLNYDLGYQSSRTRFSLVGLPETTSFSDEAGIQSMWSSSEYDSFESQKMITLGSKLKMEKGTMTSSLIQESLREPPRVALRPTSSTDAWFILNLLSAVPFLSDLSYSSTMEVLETARVDAFCINDVIVPASRRKEVLCVVWEGTCMERENNDDSDVVCRNSTFRRVSTFQVNQGAHKPINAKEVKKKNRQAVWFAGDWTGPRSLQPEKIFSGESSLSETHDIVAMSQEGVKVITIEFANLHKILKNGSALYRKYLFRKTRSTNARNTNHLQIRELSEKNTQGGLNNPSVIEILECNSTLRKLTAVQKRHLESLAEGPVQYPPGEKLWCAGTVVDKAFVIISGTAHFLPMRRNAGSSVSEF